MKISCLHNVAVTFWQFIYAIPCDTHRHLKSVFPGTLWVCFRLPIWSHGEVACKVTADGSTPGPSGTRSFRCFSSLCSPEHCQAMALEAINDLRCPMCVCKWWLSIENLVYYPLTSVNNGETQWLIAQHTNFFIDQLFSSVYELLSTYNHQLIN